MENVISQTSKPNRQLNASKILFSISLVILWGLSYTIAMSLTKAISNDVHNIIIVFLRCFFGFVFFMPFAMKAGTKTLKTKRPLLQILRAFFICSAMVCTYHAYRNLPISTASAIGFSSPLFINLLAFLFLNDKIDYKKWILILSGYIGVLVIVRPLSVDFNNATYVAILANLLASCSIIVLKKLTSVDSSTTIMFYSNSITLLLSSLIALCLWKTPEPKAIILLACIGFFATLSQFFYVQALKIEKPSFLSSFEYIRLLFAIISGYFFFKEVPDKWVSIGAIIIIFSTFYLAKLEINENKIM